MIRYVRAPGALWRSTSMFLVACVPPNTPHTITGSAALVWDCLEEPATMGELVGRLKSVVTAPPPGIGDEVDSLIEQLVTLGLVETRS